MTEHQPPHPEHPNPAELPTFSRRLGAPIATVKPAGKPPSAVTGRPHRAAHEGPENDAGASRGTTQAGSASSEPMEGGQRSDDDAEGPRMDPAERPPVAEPLRTIPTDYGVMPGPDGRPIPADEDPEQVDPNSFYAQVGGRPTFQKIVDVFYQQVEADETFKAMYPEEDLGPAKERLLMFLEQYWGGPRTYQQRRGHPRLRMRHMPFTVDAEARDTWLRFMRHAVDAAELSPMHDQVLWDYLERAAHSMVNSA